MKPSKKMILQDAVAMYRSIHPDIDESITATLEQLCKQLKQLKQHNKKIKTQAKIISRKIGDARRDGEPIDELKAAMQQQSSELNSIQARLGNIEARILEYFDLPADVEEQVSVTTPFDAERTYFSSLRDTGTTAALLADDKQEEWNAYVAGNPNASIYHRAEWRQLILKTYGHKSYYFAARNKDGQIVGVLPLIRLQSRLFGDLLVSMPYFMTGGAIADHPRIEQDLMLAANDHAATIGIGHIEYRDDIPRDSLPARSEKVNMILPLPDSSEDLWKGFSSKLRSQIKRPLHEDTLVKFGGEQYLDDFYTVYARNMRDLGSPAHSKQFVKNILDCFPDKSWIIVIRLNNLPVSAGLLVSNGATMDIPLASTIRDVNHLSMNMLLYWEVLKFAVEKGYRYFNFGRSTMGAGTYRFKQQWGARPRQLYWHYWLNGSNELPALNPSNPKYALMINTWKRLPVAISTWLGPMIVKNLP